MEIEYGLFQRQIRLTEDVDPERRARRYEHGIVTISLPVAEKPPRAVQRYAILGGTRMTDVDFEMPEETEFDLDLPATLPILALKDTVVFPQSLMPLAIGQERSIRLIDDVVSGDRFLALVTAKDASVEAPGFDDIYEVGTVAIVHKMIRIHDGTLRILVGGLHRIKLASPVSDEPYLVGEFDALPDENDDTPEVEALTRNVQGLFAQIIGARALPARGAAAGGGERR